jgi:hypothetical protein
VKARRGESVRPVFSFPVAALIGAIVMVLPWPQWSFVAIESSMDGMELQVALRLTV